jgi:AcrR family transcriptional regulator
MSRTSNVSSRERLLQAAKTLFAERGFDATTTAEIAKRANTSQSQLLKHFKDKPGLLSAALEQSWRELNAAIRLAIARLASLNDQTKLIVDMLLSYLEHDQLFRSLFLLETNRRDTLDRGAQEFAEILDGIFLQMSLRGELRPNIAPQTLRAGLLGALKNVLRQQLLSSTKPGVFSDAQAALLCSWLLSSCLRPSVKTKLARIEPELLEEQPWVDHYLELADQVIYAPGGRIPRA